MIASRPLHRQQHQTIARIERLRRRGRGVIAVAMVGAGIVLLGWITGSRSLAAPATGDQVVKVNTALAVLALGLALLLDPRRHPRIHPALAAGAAAVGVVTLLEWLTGWSLGIDEALIDDPWTATGVAAGRPAPTVAVVLALLGIGILLPSRWRRARDVVLVAASAGALTTLLGHAFGVNAFVSIGNTYATPVEASLLITLLAAGALMSAPTAGPLRPVVVAASPAGSLARRAVILAAVLPLLGGLAFHALIALAQIDVATAAWLISVAATGLALTAVLRATTTIDGLSDKLRTFIDTIPEGVYETSFNGALLVANDPLAQLLGFDDASQLLAGVHDVTALWVQPQRRDELVAAIAAGATAGTFDIELRRQDGSTFLAELTFKVVTSANGPAIGLRGTIRDVTAARAVEHQVLEAEERFRLSFHTGPLGRAVIDLTAESHRFVAINDRLADMLGYTHDELLHCEPLSFVPPDDVAFELSELQAALAAGDGIVDYDCKRRHRDGSWVPFHLSGGIARDDDGRPIYAISSMEDLRPAQAAEQELHQTRQMLESFVENVPASVYMLDPDGRFLLLNQESERIIGTPRQNVIGRTRAEVPAFADGGQTHHDNDQMVLATGHPCTVEERFGDGEDERIFLSVKFPLQGADGTVFGVGGVSTDITELHRLRAEAERAWVETTRRLAAAVEYRDEETGAHIERMAAYAELIARHLNDPDLPPACMRAAAPLHDAGKIAIPDAILLKPDTLTATERAVMETHTAIGHQLLSGTGNPELDLAASIAYTHHERWDGSGYPRRLHGNDIPLEGRIAAIADVFDALTSDRVYRKGLSVPDAVEIMTGGSGRAFDPKLLTLFLDHLDEAVAINDRSRERHHPGSLDWRRARRSPAQRHARAVPAAHG